MSTPGFKGFGSNFLISETYLFKVRNLIETLAFWPAFVRELLYTLSSPLVQNPLRDGNRHYHECVFCCTPESIGVPLKVYSALRATELDFCFSLRARMLFPSGSGKKKPTKKKLHSLFAPKARNFFGSFSDYKVSAHFLIIRSATFA